MHTLKPIAWIYLVTVCTALAMTEEQVNRSFSVKPGGTVVVDIDFGSIDVATGEISEVIIDIWRQVGRKNKADEEAFLKDRPITIAQDGNTITVRSHRRTPVRWSWGGWGNNRTEAKYTLTVPKQFNAQLTTSGGGISANHVNGEVKANTSGGGLRFAGLKGPLNGLTSGGSIQVTDCEGAIKIHTSGGGIHVTGGAGSLDGDTSGGPVKVQHFNGSARVETSGGGITIEEVKGKIDGTTSGGSISATLVSPLPDSVKLTTTGGGVTVRIAENAAFGLDAQTSGGSVKCELPVTVTGKLDRTHLKGPVNGGGQSVYLRSSGGSIRVKSLAPNELSDIPVEPSRP